MERIYSFRRAGKTIIFVSHALEMVRSLCDVAVWLDHGEQRAYGPSGQVIDAYLAEVNRQEQARLAAERAASVGEIDAQEQEENPFRRGSREVEIVRVQLLDGEGRERVVFRTGEALTIRMHYYAREQVKEPVFGVGIFHKAAHGSSGLTLGSTKYRSPQSRVKGGWIIISLCCPSTPDVIR